MPARKDPAAHVIEYFETASLDTAATVLAICRGVVARRQPAKNKPRTKAKTAQPETVGAVSEP